MKKTPVSPRPWHWVESKGNDLGFIADAYGCCIMNFGECASVDGWGSPPDKEDLKFLLDAVNTYKKRKRKRSPPNVCRCWSSRRPGIRTSKYRRGLKIYCARCNKRTSL